MRKKLKIVSTLDEKDYDNDGNVVNMRASQKLKAVNSKLGGFDTDNEKNVLSKKFLGTCFMTFDSPKSA